MRWKGDGIELAVFGYLVLLVSLVFTLRVREISLLVKLTTIGVVLLLTFIFFQFFVIQGGSYY